MKNHQIIFEEIKVLLIQLFGSDLNKHDEDTHLAIGDTGVWISADEEDLTIGSGMNHRHYHSKYDDISEAIDEFFNLLTCEKRITKYFKGEFNYKIKTEIANKNGEFKELSTSMTWLYPFWKKTKTKIETEQKLVDFKVIEKEYLKIKAMAS